MRLGRQLVVTGMAVSAFGFSTPAAADARFSGDEVRITVDDAGLARVDHAIGYRVTGSLPMGFDLTGVEPEAIVEPMASVTVRGLDGETPASGHVERKTERALHVTLDGPPRRPSAQTTLVVHVRYTVDLVRARLLTLDGALWRLSWTAPVAPEGYDAARVVFDFPAAPTEPRILSADGTTADDGRVVTLRRGAERDELELERPHVAKAEAAQWTARVDPRAFPRVGDPSLHPESFTPREPAQSRGTGAALLAALAGLLFGALARAKWAAFARACEARGVVAKGVIDVIPPLGRASLAGGALAAGIAAEAANLPVWGAIGVVLAMVFVAARASRFSRAPRGPGQWLALSPAEAFAADRDLDLLDVATPAGKLTCLFAVLASIALGFALGPIDCVWAWLVPLDALALLPIFVTGSRHQLPPDRVRSPKRRLASLHRVLKRDDSIRVAPWARLPIGTASPDELRLLVVPRAPMPGVLGIEVGVAWIETPAGYVPETEVLVRVRDASAAAARMTALGPHHRTVLGRKTDERVIRLVPALPSRGGAVALVRRLARELRDRRKTIPGIKWPGTERRLPPSTPGKGGKRTGEVPAAA